MRAVAAMAVALNAYRASLRGEGGTGRREEIILNHSSLLHTISR